MSDYVDLDAVNYRLADGTRVTNELAERWAEEIERSAGRPFLDPAGQPSMHLAFRVPASVGQQVDDLASSSGRRRSDVLREALDEYLLSHAG